MIIITVCFKPVILDDATILYHFISLHHCVIVSQCRAIAALYRVIAAHFSVISLQHHINTSQYRSISSLLRRKPA